MFSKMIVRKVIFPISSASLFTATVIAAEKKSDAQNDEEKKEMIRRKDLPIYPAKKEKKSVLEKEVEGEESALKSVVRQAREAVWTVKKEVNVFTDYVDHIVETGKAHTEASLEILRDKDNYIARYGSISIGGLVGYIFAFRRGIIRKIIYTGTGAAAVAAVVYPDEAKEYSSEAFSAAKKYITIAYHFLNGVLRDYAGVQLPSLPGPLAVGSASAAEKDASTVPSSAALMPHSASAPSHITAPLPLPPLDIPSSVSDQKKG